MEGAFLFKNYHNANPPPSRIQNIFLPCRGNVPGKDKGVLDRVLIVPNAPAVLAEPMMNVESNRRFVGSLDFQIGAARTRPLLPRSHCLEQLCRDAAPAMRFRDGEIQNFKFIGNAPANQKADHSALLLGNPGNSSTRGFKDAFVSPVG